MHQSKSQEEIRNEEELRKTNMVLGKQGQNYQTSFRADYVDPRTNSKLDQMDGRTHKAVMGNDKANYVTETQEKFKGVGGKQDKDLKKQLVKDLRSKPKPRPLTLTPTYYLQLKAKHFSYGNVKP